MALPEAAASEKYLRLLKMFFPYVVCIGFAWAGITLYMRNEVLHDKLEANKDKETNYWRESFFSTSRIIENRYPKKDTL